MTGMTTAQLELELREIRCLAGAALAAVLQMNWDKADKRELVEYFRQSALDNEFLVRWFTEPQLATVVGDEPARALRNAERFAARAPYGGYYTLPEIAAAGRDQISAIPGVGKKTMEKLDAAIEEHGLNWAAA